MARNENPPFQRGETYFGVGGSPNLNDGVHIEGQEWVFEDFDPVSRTVLSAMPVRCRAVRNVGASALLPERLVTFQAGSYGRRVSGHVATLAGECYPVDEYLPSSGIPVNDIGWIVVDGPARFRTDLSQFTAIAQGDVIVGQTAATSGATTAGRGVKQDLTGATATLANQVQNRVGVALSSCTSQGYHVSLRLLVKKW